MRPLVLALLALLAVAPMAAGYRDCYFGACANYDAKPNDAYVDAETATMRVGAGEHGSGDFRGRNAYLFAGGTYVGVFEGQHREENHTLATAGVAGTRLAYFYMEERANRYPSGYHCIELGPGAMYHRCGFGLP